MTEYKYILTSLYQDYVNFSLLSSKTIVDIKISVCPCPVSHCHTHSNLMRSWAACFLAFVNVICAHLCGAKVKSRTSTIRFPNPLRYSCLFLCVLPSFYMHCKFIYLFSSPLKRHERIQTISTQQEHHLRKCMNTPPCGKPHQPRPLLPRMNVLFLKNS
jgi:hypothetical protein